MDAGTLQMEQEWQKWHERQATNALTGSHLRNYLNYLGLPITVFSPGTRVLEIGVGFGHATHEMASLGCHVSALDICPRALESVVGCTEERYLHRNADQIPSGKFDLAVCHLVTQHMSEHDILTQFPHVYRALKPDGRFVVQWAGSTVPGENNLTESIVGEEGKTHVQNTPSMMGGRMVRDPEYVKDLVSRCGGIVLETRCRFDWTEYSSYWFTTETKAA